MAPGGVRGRATRGPAILLQGLRWMIGAGRDAPQRNGRVKPRRRLAAITLVVLTGFAWAILGVPPTMAITAEVIQPISIAELDPLTFGLVIPPGTGTGTVTVSASPSANRSGSNVTFLDSFDFASGRFGVVGQADNKVMIILPAIPTTLERTASPGPTLTVDTFTSLPSGTVTLSGIGTLILYVGATLHVGALQPAGDYTGTYLLTIEYE